MSLVRVALVVLVACGSSASQVMPAPGPSPAATPPASAPDARDDREVVVEAHRKIESEQQDVLDEDALFAATASMGSDAQAIHAACGGSAAAPTTPDQEQSFHACW
jgi:hypothetical protein